MSGQIANNDTEQAVTEHINSLPDDAPETANPESTVLLVDDHAIWRGGVRSMLEDTEFRIIGEAGSGWEALEKARALRPQIALLDIRMAGGWPGCVAGIEGRTSNSSCHHAHDL